MESARVVRRRQQRGEGPAGSATRHACVCVRLCGSPPPRTGMRAAQRKGVCVCAAASTTVRVGGKGQHSAQGGHARRRHMCALHWSARGGESDDARWRGRAEATRLFTARCEPCGVRRAGTRAVSTPAAQLGVTEAETSTFLTYMFLFLTILIKSYFRS